MKKVILIFLLMTISVACTGCTMGIKQKNSIVFVSPRPIPEAAKGTPIIATNKRLPLAILNREDLEFQQNIGGYVVVDPHFYGLLIKTYKESKGKK